MRLSEMREVLAKQPSEPFRLRMSNGDEYVVRHPEFVALTKTRVFVGVGSGRDEVPDRHAELDLLRVVSVEPASAARRRAARGSPKK